MSTPSRSKPETSAEPLHSDLVEIVRRVDAIDVRGLEGAPVQRVWDELRPPVVTALDDALSLLARILRRYDGESIPPPPPGPAADQWNRGFDLGLDTLVRQDPSRARVADLAFMASFELRKKKDALRTVEVGEDSWQLLEELDGARRRVKKTLTAVAAMLCEAEGFTPELGFASELQTSLATRQAYAKLRQSIGESEEPADDELHVRMRGVGTQIAMLVGRSVYADLRVGDRVEIRSLQARILEWLRTFAPSSESYLSGRRLWGDLAGFARVLVQVSQRQEVLEHDAHVIAVASAALCGSETRGDFPAPLIARLDALRGLDDELDGLLDARSVDRAAWCPVLERLRSRFVRTDPAASQTEPISWGEM